MKPIPGWLSGLIVLVLVFALGVAAIIPREVNVVINSTNNVENTTHYNAPVNHHY
ncbi:MAG: hypothetical protein ACWA5L_08060 [bacterium]